MYTIDTVSIFYNRNKLFLLLNILCIPLILKIIQYYVLLFLFMINKQVLN